MRLPRLIRVVLFTLVLVASAHALTFEDWQAEKFTAAELADPAVSGEAASPAGDGLSNLLKYAFDLDPHVPSAEGAPQAGFLAGHLALNFFRRYAANDLLYALEASPDLVHWSIRNSLLPSAQVHLGAVAQWTVVDPYSWPAPNKFLRLRVVRGGASPQLFDPPEQVEVKSIAAPLQVELRWSDRSNTEIGYLIERQRVTDGVWDLFAVTGEDTIFYSDHTAQSGVAYNYRIRAMFPSNPAFPGGHFSAWSESGAVTPVSPGGGGGGVPPDPDPDTDNDTFKDSVDAYPHDNRRSRDLPVLSYVAVDVSSAVTALPIQAVALDEQNTVAFAYEDATKLYAAVTRDGATVGSPLEVIKARTITYDIQVPDNSPPYDPNKKKTVTETATGEFGFAPGSGGSLVNSAGHLTGWIIYSAPGGAFRRVFIATTSTPVEIYPPAPSPLPDYHYPGLPYYCCDGWASFLGNTDTSAGGFYTAENFVASGTTAQWFAASDANIPGATETTLDLTASSFNGKAAGFTYDYAPPYAMTNVLWPAQTSLGSLSPRAVNDSGLVLGVQPSLLPGQYDVALSNPSGKLADSLPAVYRQQIRLTTDGSFWINNQGDLVIGGAQILEGPEDVPVWRERTILWRKATGELFVVQFPVGLSSVKQFNNAGCFTAIADKAILDAQGNPVLDAYNHPTYRAVAQLLVPVEVITRDPDKTKTEPSEGVVAEADPKPEVELHLESAEFNADGDLEVTVSGKVKDRLSEVLTDSSSRVQNLHFLVNGEDVGQEVALSYTQSPAVFKVVESETTFTETVTIIDPKPGSYVIQAETDQNAAGNTGWGKVAVGIDIEPSNQNLPADPNQLSITFTQAPGATQVDSAQIYIGNREPVSSDGTVTETAANSWTFSGSIIVGTQPATCTMRMRPLGVSDSENDNLVAEVRYTLPGGIEQVITGSWVETGNSTLRFYPDGYQIGSEELVINSTQELPGSKGGSFEPLIFRADVPDGWVQSSGFKIQINGEDHALKKFTYEGKESHYVVADASASRPKVFIASSKTLPAEVTVPAPGADGAGIEWTMELGGRKSVLGEVLVVSGAEPAAPPVTAAAGPSAPQATASGWKKPGDTITEDDLLTAYRFIYPDELSQLLLDTYRSAGHHIFLENVYGDYDFVGYRLDQKLAIHIEHNDNDVHPGIAAQYLWMGLNKALTDYSFRAAIRDASPSSDLQTSVLTAWRQQVGPTACEAGVAAAELYLSGIGIVNEPLDWVLVVNDVAEGHYTSLAAALPFIPRGLMAAGRKIKIKNTAGDVLETFTDAAKLDAAKGLYRESDLRVMGVTMEQHQFGAFLRDALSSGGGPIRVPDKHGGLKKNMLAAGAKPNWGKQPPKLCRDGKYRSYDIAQAHHDFPWYMRKWFADHGLDVNNPAFGRWSSQADHYTWHNEMSPPFNVFWEDFRALEAGRDPYSAAEIMQKLQEARSTYPVLGATYNP